MVCGILHIVYISMSIKWVFECITACQLPLYISPLLPMSLLLWDILIHCYWSVCLILLYIHPLLPMSLLWWDIHYYWSVCLILHPQGSSQRESGDTGESLSSQGTKSMYARESLIVINYKKLNQDLKDVSHSRQTLILSFLFFLSFFFGG